MAQNPTLTFLGLVTSPNQLTVKDGALTIAQNVVIDREDVVEPSRGFKLYGAASSGITKQILQYKGRLIKHFNSTLAWDTKSVNGNNESVFNDFSGSFSEVDSGLRIKSVESNNNLYLTTSNGIKKISARTAADFSQNAGYITNAGGVKAINGQAFSIYEPGQQTGFLPANSTVAYRLLWGTRDINDNLQTGTPSERIIVTSPAQNALVNDFNNLLLTLDNITTTLTSAFISDNNYVASLGLSSTSTALEIRNAILNLARKIDFDIFLSNSTAVPAVPLRMSAVSISASVCTVTFNSGNPTQYLSVGDTVNLTGFSSTNPTRINGLRTLTDVTATTIAFTTEETGSVTFATAEIRYGNYQTLLVNLPFNNSVINLNTQQMDNPATGNQLSILQTAIREIHEELLSEPTTIITSSNQTNFVSRFAITTSSNVRLVINIPQAINEQYFLQIYRSNINTATGTTLLTDLFPDDNMKLVYEEFPTASEISARQMTVTDITVDDFSGADLYTNPSGTGEGLAQANDVPPIAKDINRYNNVVFYGNTKTRERLLIDLLGVSTFKAGGISSISTNSVSTVVVTDAAHNLANNDIVYVNGTGLSAVDTRFAPATVINASTFSVPVTGSGSAVLGYWTNSLISVITDSSVNNYKFIRGRKEVRTVTSTSFAATTSAGYFTLCNANDRRKFYVWMDKTGTDVDPAPAGFDRGIRVVLVGTTTAAEVATKTGNSIRATLSNLFTVSVSSATITVTNLTDGPSTDTTLTNLAGWSTTTTVPGRGENPVFNEILLSSEVSPSIALEETSRSILNVINRNANEKIYAYYLSGTQDIPGKFFLEGRDLNTTTFYLLANNNNVGSNFTPSISPVYTTPITNTAASPTVITANNHGLVSGDYVLVAFTNSSPTIEGNRLVTFISNNTFSIPVNVSTAGTTGIITKTSEATASENQTKINRLYYSKFQQPESVPLGNYLDVGSEEAAILRIFPLRGSLFVFKEDGLFRVSGDFAPFSLELFDSSCVLIAPDSIGVANNQLFVWTRLGIQVVTESGVSDPISEPIDLAIQRLGSSAFPNFSKVTWGVGYDSDYSYVVWTNSDPSDTYATIAYRYSLRTKRWTNLTNSATCGIVYSDQDKLYLGATDVNRLEEERKSFDRSDYAGREITQNLNINNYIRDSGTMKLSSVLNIEEGDVILQNQYVTVYNYNALLAKLDTDATVGFNPIFNLSTSATAIVVQTYNLSFVPGSVSANTIAAVNNFSENEKIRLETTGSLPSGLLPDVDYFAVNVQPTSFQVANIPSGNPIRLANGGTGVHSAFKYHNCFEGDYVRVQNLLCDRPLDHEFRVKQVINGYTVALNNDFMLENIVQGGTFKYLYEKNLPMVAGEDIRFRLELLAGKLNSDPGSKRNDFLRVILPSNKTFAGISAANPTIISMRTIGFLPAAVSVSTSVIALPSHGLSTDEEIYFTTTGALPAGVVASRLYYVDVVDANSIRLKELPGAIQTVQITSQGTGTHSLKLSHGLRNQRYVQLIGTNSTPTINNLYKISYLDNNTFTVPASVTISGTSGQFNTQVSDYLDILACFNILVETINLDAGITQSNFKGVTDVTAIESLITSVNPFTNELVASPNVDYLVGPVYVNKAIERVFVTAPITMGDPINYKQLREAQMLFENKRFSKATMGFASDLLPEIEEIEFLGDGNGIFGFSGGQFGAGFFGGGSHGAPFRTYVPRNKQRCRYLIIKFSHKVARETFAVFGITLTGNVGLSSRTYRR